MASPNELTCLVPCFNAARFLPALVDNFRAQQVRAGTLLLYDDGSTDDTTMVAQRLGCACRRNPVNRGVAFARNRLAESARTEWLHFCDADDPIHPEFVKKLLVRCTDGIDVVTCDADWVMEDGTLVRAWRYEPECLAINPAAYLLENPIGLVNCMVRRARWQEIRGCDERLDMWEDADLHYRLARSGARFQHVSSVLFTSIRRPTSFSHDYARNWRARLLALRFYAQDGLQPSLQSAWGSEVQKAAAELLRWGDLAGTKEALALGRAEGARLPMTRHRLLRMLRPFLSDFNLLRLQEAWRRRAALRHP